MQHKELLVLVFLILYALGFAFLVYKAWGIWESNQVLNRKMNALKHLQDHELTGMSNMIRETFGAMGGLTKDLVEFYKVNPPTADFKFDGLQQSINRLMSHMGELHKKERDRLTANFNDNEYH